ncbi:MAG: queuosine precursor transporter [Candidatus Aenigmarchaeota archaeon]|nr:queuosine precursor transporter [Candidatus Aenigmarchaeota archaeon]
MLTEILYILIVLSFATLVAVIGKRHGVEYIIAVFAGLVLVANMVASKVVTFGNFVVPAAIIAYSATFLLTDILSEKWGKKYAKKAVWCGFLASVAMVIIIKISVLWTPAIFMSEEFLSAFNMIFSSAPRIVFASMIAYLISQHHDVIAFEFWKKQTGGKYLWLRNNASTVVSQFIDSAIFVTIAFWGVMPIAPLIFGQWVVKMIIAVIDTPFIYLACSLIDKTKAKSS